MLVSGRVDQFSPVMCVSRILGSHNYLPASRIWVANFAQLHGFQGEFTSSCNDSHLLITCSIFEVLMIFTYDNLL